MIHIRNTTCKWAILFTYLLTIYTQRITVGTVMVSLLDAVQELRGGGGGGVDAHNVEFDAYQA